MRCALMSVLASSSRVSMHDPQHGGGRCVSSWVLFFVTVRPRCLSSSSLSSALGVDLVGTGLSCHLRCGVLGVFPVTFWCSSLSSLSILEELNKLVWD